MSNIKTIYNKRNGLSQPQQQEQQNQLEHQRRMIYLHSPHRYHLMA